MFRRDIMLVKNNTNTNISLLGSETKTSTIISTNIISLWDLKTRINNALIVHVKCKHYKLYKLYKLTGAKQIYNHFFYQHQSRWDKKNEILMFRRNKNLVA